MLIYEVNIVVRESIADAYVQWLRDHIEQILRFDGFRYGALLRLDGAEPGTRAYTAHYMVDDRASLDAYFDQHAAAMRQDGIDRFGDGFTATRRVMEIIGEFESREFT